MKKILAVMAILLVVSVTLALAEEIPAPLQKVKEFCLASNPDQDGDYLLRFPGVFKEQDVEFILGYFPRFGVVGIGIRNENGSYIIQFIEETKEFGVYSNGDVFPIEEELAIDMAFQIFRGMVEGKII